MATDWPQEDFASMVGYFGNVGEHQARLALPYPMRLSWEKTKTVTKISCHEKVKDSLERILAGIYAHYGHDDDKLRAERLDLFGGCLNVRRIRGGNSWSIHSWGAAIDLDPNRNTMKMHRDDAAMPDAVIDIFESESWISMGRSRDFDFMHFQAARL